MNLQTNYTRQGTNQLLVERDFNAPLATVWEAWTQPELIDQWWAPKPWKARTQSMEFKPGGTWMYYMEGPQGERHYCRVDYQNIEPQQFFSGDDAFCDEKGNVMKEPPGMNWKVSFKDMKEATSVNVIITFASEEDLQKIVEMGFKEGFAAAHTNLDELLQKELA